MAASHKRNIGKMWMRFEGGRCVSIAGPWDTSQETAEGKARARGKAETEARYTPKGTGKMTKGTGKKGSGKLRGFE